MEGRGFESRLEPGFFLSFLLMQKNLMLLYFYKKDSIGHWVLFNVILLFYDLVKYSCVLKAGTVPHLYPLLLQDKLKPDIEKFYIQK